MTTLPQEETFKATATIVPSESVTTNDAIHLNGGITPMFFGTSSWGNSLVSRSALPPDLLMRSWSHDRDKILRATLNAESMWASAIFKAITKLSSMPWSLEDTTNSQRRLSYYKDIFIRANSGAGWGNFLSKHLADFLLTDNGAFVELIWSTPKGGKLLGIAHLDSGRCHRTGNPDTPVQYIDRLGHWHNLARHQVICFSDMPDPSETYFDLGICAAHRAYRTIAKLANIETYSDEKISGNRATALHILQGITDTGLGAAITTARTEQIQKNAHMYMGAILAPVMGDSPLNLVSINLKEAPDGFDFKTERDNAYMIYANAIGVPVQDIQPLSGQGLGTGTQSIVLAESAEGQGLASWRKQWEHMVGEFLLPATTSFVFASNDTRDKKATAELQKQQSDTLSSLIQSQIITSQQALQIAVDIQLVPREFLQTEDMTAGSSINDNEKIVPETAPKPVVEEAPQTPPVSEQAQTTKATETQRAKMDILIARTRKKIADLAATMQDGQTNINQWQQSFADILKNAHAQAYRIGNPNAKDASAIGEYFKSQLRYLDNFAKDVEQRGWSQAKDTARSQLYGQATKASFWSGATQGWALPSMPADGTTECLVNCHCSWRIDDLGNDNADCYWILGQGEHCPICEVRSQSWNPLKIRNGVVVNE